MHKLGIIISVKPKIMIISQDVHFGIKRQCAQVELKNINIFSKKNNLGSICRNGKQFIQQYLLHNFVQFLAQKLVMN
jgi:peroxiredoxin